MAEKADGMELEVIDACVRLQLMNDLLKAAASDGRTDIAQWLLSQMRQYEGSLEMLVRHAQGRIAELDQLDVLTAAQEAERSALASGIDRARNILALVQTRRPRLADLGRRT